MKKNEIRTYVTRINIFSKSDLAKWGLEFSTGYFLSDCIVLYKLKEYYAKDTILYVGHHIVSIFGLTQTIKGGGKKNCFKLPYVQVYFLLILRHAK